MLITEESAEKFIRDINRIIADYNKHNAEGAARLRKNRALKETEGKDFWEDNGGKDSFFKNIKIAINSIQNENIKNIITKVAECYNTLISKDGLFIDKSPSKELSQDEKNMIQALNTKKAPHYDAKTGSFEKRKGLKSQTQNSERVTRAEREKLKKGKADLTTNRINKSVFTYFNY